jgi:hypothetical protein
MWFPLLLFGGLSLLSIPVVLGYGVGWSGLYWGVAGPVGGVLTALFYALSGRRIGLEVPGRPYVVATCVIVAGAVTAGVVGGIAGWPVVSVAGPPLAVCAGLLLIARLARSASLAWLAGIVAVIDVGLLVAGAGAKPSAVLLALAYGLPAVIFGLCDLRRGRS